MLKILFIGTVEFSKRMLEKLLHLNAEVVGVISMPDNSLNSDYIDFRDLCAEKNLSHLQTNDINSVQVISWIKDKSPDIIFCFGWSRLLSKELLQIAPAGVIGYHPAELPSNKGRHPLIWALVLGLKQTGSTFFQMDEGADSGDIVSQASIAIDYNDNAKTLYEKVIHTASRQLESLYHSLICGTLSRIKQNSTNSNYWRKRSKFDGRIDFRMSSLGIYNLVRALSSPYPGAYFLYQGDEVKVWQAKEIKFDKIENIEPGKVLKITDKSLFVKTGDNAIEFISHELNLLPQVGDYLL